MNEEEKIEKIKQYLDLCKVKYDELKEANERKKEIGELPTSKEYLHKNEMDLISKYLEEKDSLIKKILTTLFKNNSVIIEGKLSMRRGEFREFRGHSELSLLEVKERIYNYCNFIKLTDEEKNVLEFCLELVTPLDYESWRGLRQINDKWKAKNKKLKEIFYLFNDTESEFKCLNLITLFPNGTIEFSFNDDENYDEDEDNSRRSYSRRSYSDMFNEEEIDLLTYFLQNEINKLKEKFDEEMGEERLRLENEIKGLKDKGGKYLLVASLNTNLEK